MSSELRECHESDLLHCLTELDGTVVDLEDSTHPDYSARRKRFRDQILAPNCLQDPFAPWAYDSHDLLVRRCPLIPIARPRLIERPNRICCELMREAFAWYHQLCQLKVKVKNNHKLIILSPCTWCGWGGPWTCDKCLGPLCLTCSVEFKLCRNCTADPERIVFKASSVVVQQTQRSSMMNDLMPTVNGVTTQLYEDLHRPQIPGGVQFRD